MEYEELLQKVPQTSIPVNEVVTTWYSCWIEDCFIQISWGLCMRNTMVKSIEFLHIINGNLNDMQTIYTTPTRTIKGSAIIFL